MKYAAHVFDMDGVLIASAASKSEAFYRAALPYGEDAAKALVEFHEHAGSISRRARFEHFFANILKRKPDAGELDELMRWCGTHILRGALAAPKLPGLERFLSELDCDAFVVSGVEQTELETILEAQHLTPYFARIWGGNKAELFPRLIADGDIPLPAVYYGDEFADLVAAQVAGLDFVFVASASRWAEGRWYCAERQVQTIEDFRRDVEAVA